MRLDYLFLTFLILPACSDGGFLLREAETVPVMQDAGFWVAEYINEPLSDKENDPLLISSDWFADSQYRVITKVRPDAYRLYRTSDFRYFEILSEDILPERSRRGRTFQDHIVFAAGSPAAQALGYSADTGPVFVLYESAETGEVGTFIWHGTDLKDLELLGRVLTETDCGVVLNADTGVVHIFAEDPEKLVPPSSYALTHWTSPATDLLAVTKHERAIDTELEGRKTGDPEFLYHASHYWMFADLTTPDHPNYRIGVWVSKDLFEWERAQEVLLSDVKGGDLSPVKGSDEIWHAMTEYSGRDEIGIGYLRLRFELPNRY